MNGFKFKTTVKSKKSRARVGVITTPHGDIQTPAFVTVGTKATVKSLAPDELEKTGTQFIFANTYHLTISPGADIVEKHGGIHKMSGISKPTITDSGGFQVFSLAFPNRKNMFELRSRLDEIPLKQNPTLVKITDDGVEFRSHTDGTKYLFTPEVSIKAQKQIGADFIVAFDECIYNGATKKYTERATSRTYEWARRSIAEYKVQSEKFKIDQQVYGVIQGGRFQDLREKSTREITSLPFFGIALGGVSVGETNEELREEIGWIMKDLEPDPRPRHLLGISTIDDVLFAVSQGIDTFDCILPTRDARIGRLYFMTGDKIEIVDILDTNFKTDLRFVNESLLGTVTFAYLHHLFKQRELLSYRLATMHNLRVIEDFFAKIREQIQNGDL